MSENVKAIFKRALLHYVKVLEKLKDDDELQFSNDIFREDIQNNVDKIQQLIIDMDSFDATSTLDKNRNLMCNSLHNYISDLEKIKDLVTGKLENMYEFTNVNEELELAKRIQIGSCTKLGF